MSDDARFKKDRDLLKWSSPVYLIAGVIFWVWAIVNVARGAVPFDSGVVIFIFPMIVGVIGRKLPAHGDELPEASSLVKAHYYLTVTSNFLITLAYIGGAVIIDSVGFKAYCIVAAFCWAVFPGGLVLMATYRYQKEYHEILNKNRRVSPGS